jgi:hypothetical protein
VRALTVRGACPRPNVLVAAQRRRRRSTPHRGNVSRVGCTTTNSPVERPTVPSLCTSTTESWSPAGPIPSLTAYAAVNDGATLGPRADSVVDGGDRARFLPSRRSPARGQPTGAKRQRRACVRERTSCWRRSTPGAPCCLPGRRRSRTTGPPQSSQGSSSKRRNVPARKLQRVAPQRRQRTASTQQASRAREASASAAARTLTAAQGSSSAAGITAIPSLRRYASPPAVRTAASRRSAPSVSRNQRTWPRRPARTSASTG